MTDCISNWKKLGLRLMREDTKEPENRWFPTINYPKHLANKTDLALCTGRRCEKKLGEKFVRKPLAKKEATWTANYFLTKTW